MPSLNFQSRFAALVESGAKRQTIRAKRKHPVRVGQPLYLYTGLRRPGARLLKIARCEEVHEIEIVTHTTRRGIWIDGWKLTHEKATELAKADGFETPGELIDWFCETHGAGWNKPFRGQVIRW